MNSGSTLFEKEAVNISDVYPGLALIERPGKWIVAGKLILIDNEGVVQDNYAIEIQSVPDYPLKFPLVFETGGRIPRNIDWHIFETDGHCCLKNQPEEILICRRGIDLESFIEREVKPYFFNQAYREKYGFYLQERSHGLLGQLEFFFDLFRTKDLLKLYKFMTFVRKRSEPTRSADCFCGSGEKYRRCHREAYRTMCEFTDREFGYFLHELTHSNAFVRNYPVLALQLSESGS